MPSAKEIKSRIASIKDTQKITNAMYLISSTKLRKAKNELNRTRPYFDALKGEIKRIFRTVPDVDSRYFYPPAGAPQRSDRQSSTRPPPRRDRMCGSCTSG